MSKRKASPAQAPRVAAWARDHLPCLECGVPAGHGCPRPGRGRIVHRGRYAVAASALSQRDKEARRPPEQTELLARLPRRTEEEIEAARTPRGGWTREQLAEWGVPWPPPAGWRHALLRGEDGRNDG